MSQLPGYEERVECPYNKSHQIIKSRFQTHLVKCRKSYPGAAKETCPFNPTHLVNAPEFNHHKETCPDRASLVQYAYSVQSSGSSRKPAEVHVAQFQARAPSGADDDDNWDDDDCPAYNPQAYVEGAPVLRTLNLAPPSERKAFRNAERKRLNNIPK